MTKKEYIRKNDYILKKIVGFWCLARYARLSNKVEKFEQWKNELLKLMIEISTIDLDKNNTELNRLHILKRMSNLFDLKSKTALILINDRTFLKEGVDIDTIPMYNEIVNDYIKETKKIFNLLAKQDKEKIRNYVNNL